jgi:hypothetical protein
MRTRVVNEGRLFVGKSPLGFIVYLEIAMVILWILAVSLLCKTRHVSLESRKECTSCRIAKTINGQGREMLPSRATGAIG